MVNASSGTWGAYAVCEVGKRSEVGTQRAKRNITNRLFEIGDNIVPVLLLLEAGKGHDSARDVLHVIVNMIFARDFSLEHTFLGFRRYSNSVSSFQVIPFFTFASEYLKPAAWPV